MSKHFGLLLLLAVGIPAYGQFQNGNQTALLNLPELSRRAVITQRVGITDITLTYHRPDLVEDHALWERYGAQAPTRTLRSSLAIR
jgi:hypothetical protein